MSSCYKCNQLFNPPVYRNSICESCGADLKVCLNCEFYSPGSHWDCRETIGEIVKDKDRSNFCDFFTPAKKRSGQAASENTGSANSAFNKLFNDE